MYLEVPEVKEHQPMLLVCPNCGEYTLVCDSERKCTNQPFGPAIPEDEREYTWYHTNACHVIKRLKEELSARENENA